MFLNNLRPIGLDSLALELTPAEQGTTTLLLHQMDGLRNLCTRLKKTCCSRPRF